MAGCNRPIRDLSASGRRGDPCGRPFGLNAGDHKGRPYGTLTSFRRCLIAHVRTRRQGSYGSHRPGLAHTLSNHPESPRFGGRTGAGPWNLCVPISQKPWRSAAVSMPSANCRLRSGKFGHVQEDDEAKLACYVEAVAAARECDDPLQLAHAVRHLGDVHRHAGSREAAHACYDEALTLYRNADAPPTLDVANAVRPMAILQADLGNTGRSANSMAGSQGSLRDGGHCRRRRRGGAMDGAALVGPSNIRTAVQGSTGSFVAIWHRFKSC